MALKLAVTESAENRTISNGEFFAGEAGEGLERRLVCWGFHWAPSRKKSRQKGDGGLRDRSGGNVYGYIYVFVTQPSSILL